MQTDQSAPLKSNTSEEKKILPVILLVEIADSHQFRATAHRELIFRRRPLDACSGSIDPQQHQGLYPDAVFVLPHVGIPVSAAGDDAVRVGRPVDARHT